MWSSGESPFVANVWTICCIQVVPDFGNEATKMSPALSGSAAQAETVAVEVMGNIGMGSSSMLALESRINTRMATVYEL